jgi:hypothetical protein
MVFQPGFNCEGSGRRLGEQRDINLSICQRPWRIFMRQIQTTKTIAYK